MRKLTGFFIALALLAAGAQAKQDSRPTLGKPFHQARSAVQRFKARQLPKGERAVDKSRTSPRPASTPSVEDASADTARPARRRAYPVSPEAGDPTQDREGSEEREGGFREDGAQYGPGRPRGSDR